MKEFRLKDEKLINKGAKSCVLKTSIHAWHGLAIREPEKLRIEEEKNAKEKD